MQERKEDRPSYVTFEVRAVEDRAASLQNGHFSTKDVVYAVITPQGSRDRIERVADEWFLQLEQQVREERLPAEWARSYRNAYEAFLKGQEPALNGMDVRNWPAASPAQVKTLLAAHVKTVEDLAAANEETIGRLGMGGRALKERAVSWLQSAQSQGKNAEELAALRQENADLKIRNAALEERVGKLEAVEKGAKR